MDIPLVLEVLRPGEDWGPCAQSDSTYAAMAAKWRGSSAVPTEAEMGAAWTAIQASRAANFVAALKARAVSAFTDAKDDSAQRDRAIVLTLVDGINFLRDGDTSFKVAVAASTNLANLKTRVDALSNLPARSTAYARTAITNKINSGAAD